MKRKNATKKHRRLELNSAKILKELGRIEMSKAELAKHINKTPRNIYYLLDNKTSTLVTINDIAKVLNLDPKDLLITR